MNTRITELFSIDFPVIAGGMVWCSGWRLAAAVSNSGGLGLIGAGSMTPELLAEHIELCRKATDKVFGVNIPLMNPNIANATNVAYTQPLIVIFSYLRK